MENKKITHVVFKGADFVASCDAFDSCALDIIEKKVAEHRARTGREPEPRYLVINTDEPYVEEVIDVLKRHGHWE